MDTIFVPTQDDKMLLYIDVHVTKEMEKKNEKKKSCFLLSFFSHNIPNCSDLGLFAVAY